MLELNEMKRVIEPPSRESDVSSSSGSGSDNSLQIFLFNTKIAASKSVIQISILTIMFIAWIGTFYYYFVHQNDNQSSPLYSVTTKRTIGRELKLILFGDSLIQKPSEGYHLVQEIQKRLPGFVVISSGKNGQHLDELEARVQKDVVNQRPDVVFFFWDSDYSATLVSKIESANFKREYIKNAKRIIATIKNSTYVIVSGPTLLSEGPLFRPSRFKGYNPSLDTYVQINSKICEDLNVTYIDMHTPFRDSIPTFWLFYKWFITADGEHGNYRGSALIADKLAEKISIWLKDNNY